MNGRPQKRMQATRKKAFNLGCRAQPLSCLNREKTKIQTKKSLSTMPPLRHFVSVCFFRPSGEDDLHGDAIQHFFLVAVDHYRHPNFLEPTEPRISPPPNRFPHHIVNLKHSREDDVKVRSARAGSSAPSFPETTVQTTHASPRQSLRLMLSGSPLFAVLAHKLPQDAYTDAVSVSLWYRPRPGQTPNYAITARL
jgi:hypothetical protein